MWECLFGSSVETTFVQEEIQFLSVLLIEYLTILRKNTAIKERNRRRILYLSKITFVVEEEHTQLSLSLFLSSPFTVCHMFCLQLWDNGHIKAQQWSRNGSFTKVYKRHLSFKIKCRKNNEVKNEHKFSKVKICTNFLK